MPRRASAESRCRISVVSRATRSASADRVVGPDVPLRVVCAAPDEAKPATMSNESAERAAIAWKL